ncbi:MAG: transcriptional repressor [SAR202 cluster bacterium]|nr:transcriptional repressor [SAR202 cluster bacterium]
MATAMAHEHADARPDLLPTLEDRGYRLTGPRLRIAEHLARRRGSFTAEELAGELPGLGRATVYRTVKLLLDAGVLCKATLPDGAARYSLDGPHHHHHFVCVSCGKVQEFRHPAVERLVRAIRSDVPGELVGHRIELYMNCAECLARGQE